jgi:hypothetical protein
VLVRVLLPFLMMLEGISTAFRFARFVDILVIYPPLVVALLIARAGVGALLFASGWMLRQRRLAAPSLGQWSLIVSAALATLEVGFSLAPTSIFPSYRWPAVALYWAYALGACWWLSRGRSL